MVLLFVAQAPRLREAPRLSAAGCLNGYNASQNLTMRWRIAASGITPRPVFRLSIMYPAAGLLQFQSGIFDEPAPFTDFGGDVRREFARCAAHGFDAV